MKTFKNKNYTKRDYECANIVACVAESAPNDNYIEADEVILTRLTLLYKENGVEYYGFL